MSIGEALSGFYTITYGYDDVATRFEFGCGEFTGSPIDPDLDGNYFYGWYEEGGSEYEGVFTAEY